MIFPSERKRFSHLRRNHVIALMVAGILSTFLLFHTLKRRQEERERHNFERNAAYQRAEIQSRTDGLVEVLFSVRAYYESSKTVQRSEFRRFVTDFLARYPELESIEFLKRVGKEGRDEFEARARAEGIEAVPRVDVPMSKSAQRTSARDEYFPIWHFEPLERGRSILGKNAADAPGMWPVMQKARETNLPAATAGQILDRIDGTPAEKLAVTILLPVRSRISHLPIFKGFVVCVLRVGGILSLSLKNGAPEPLIHHLSELGLPSIGPQVLRASTNPKTGIMETVMIDAVPSIPGKDTWQGTITVADREWSLTSHHTSSHPGLTWSPYLALVLGALITGALVLHQHRLSRHESRIEKKVEERTRELVAIKQFLESVVENMPDVVFVKDANTLRYLRFNKAGEKLLEVTREEVIGKSDAEIFSEADANVFNAADKEVIERREPLEIEESVRTFHGSRIFHTKKIPILDETGHPKYILGISEDITEEKAAREALAKKAAELERSNAELEQLAYVASHDLQEPLRMIASYTSLLEKRYGHLLDEKGHQYINYASEGALRLRCLITDLLTLSQIGTVGRAVGPVDLNHVLRIVQLNLQVSIEETGATITNTRLPCVRGDEMELVRLFQNLLENSIKFRGSAFPKVRVTSRRSGRFHVISVRDNGIGIQREYLDRIFTVFQRLHTRDQYSGTGIGLALCKKIVECHGGSIELESTPGTGTIFHFTLPATDSSEHNQDK